MRLAALAFVAAFSLATPMLIQTAAAQNIFKDVGSKLKNLGGSGGVSDTEVAGGLKDALRVGADTVTGDLGAKNGFFGDPSAHIPLPGYMKTAQKVMKFAGQGKLLDDVELRINRAAEGSMKAAKNEFGKAIRQMTFTDARKILNGPDDSATRYFESKMTSPLGKRMRPIVTDQLNKTDAFKAYDRAAAAKGGAALAGKGKDALVDHSVEGALKGLFHYIAKEEAAIRNNPAKRVTPLLKKVFK